jgi:hypothetical protein
MTGRRKTMKGDKNMQGHHLVLGKIDDFITGESLTDTHDERYRQKIAEILVNRKNYAKSEIVSRYNLRVAAGTQCAVIKIDFLIILAEKIRMLVKYGPGSLVTRRRPALSAGRLVAPYQVPVVVVTNGEDAEILDGASGKKIAAGFESIPNRRELISRIKDLEDIAIPKERALMESRIVYAFEVDGSCPCDDTICRL